MKLLLPCLNSFHSTEQVHVASRVLFYHIFYIVRFQSFSKLSPRDHILHLDKMQYSYRDTILLMEFQCRFMHGKKVSLFLWHEWLLCACLLIHAIFHPHPHKGHARSIARPSQRNLETHLHVTVGAGRWFEVGLEDLGLLRDVPVLLSLEGKAMVREVVRIYFF
jgi:hypothetical protein